VYYVTEFPEFLFCSAISQTIFPEKNRPVKAKMTVNSQTIFTGSAYYSLRRVSVNLAALMSAKKC
jgi:hypothetical protein